MSSIPLVMYKFAGSPYENWQHLAWAGALVVTVFIFLLSLFARIVLLRKATPND
jgi:phosphate transport system permease protein